MPDTTKASLYSPYRAFKNNAVYTGTFSITGTTVVGLNTRTFTRVLSTTPDMVDISFNGPTGGSDPRPAGGWFKQGFIWVATNNAGGGNPSSWRIYASINGTTLTVTAIYVQAFVTAEALTSTSFSYRVVDYSVF